MTTNNKLSHITLIEDDSNLCATLVGILKSYCENLAVFDCVAAAVKFFDRESTDLVVADFMLKDGNLLDLLLESPGNMRVIAISAIATPTESFELAHLGVKRYLSKPFSLAEFSEVLSAVITEITTLPKIEIKSFGGLEIWQNGVELDFKRKKPHSLLALLRALIAEGAVAVPTHRLFDILWDDSDGDSANNKLQTYLHRLRKLIGPSSVVQKNNMIGLNQDVVDLDIWNLLKLQKLSLESLKEEDLAVFKKPWLPEDESYWLIESRKKYECLASQLVEFSVSA